MSVSLEQCLIMVRNHNLENNLTQYVLDDLRRLFFNKDISIENIKNNYNFFSQKEWYEIRSSQKKCWTKKVCLQ
jgi:hypothetical protein